MIMQQLKKSQFRDEFHKVRPDNFSYEGLGALYDWLEEYYSEADQPYDLDVIALCCEFSEYDSLQQFNEDYNREYENIDDITDDTWVIKINSEKFIIQNF